MTVCVAALSFSGREPRLAAALLLCCLLTVASSGWSQGEQDHNAVIEAALARGYITANELASLVDSGAAPPVLDVRSPREFAKGHVPGAVNIPFNKVSKRLAEVPSTASQPLVVYCAHGPRAFIARHSLRKNGVRPIILLKGHWHRWVKQGHPVEQ